MKNELRVQYDDCQKLNELIDTVYFKDGTMGKISRKDEVISIDREDILYTIFKGMHNMTVKVHNAQTIDGIMKFIVNEDKEDISISPISIYCIKEGDKYSFY